MQKFLLAFERALMAAVVAIFTFDATPLVGLLLATFMDWAVASSIRAKRDTPRGAGAVMIARVQLASAVKESWSRMAAVFFLVLTVTWMRSVGIAGSETVVSLAGGGFFVARAWYNLGQTSPLLAQLAKALERAFAQRGIDLPDDDDVRPTPTNPPTP